MQILYVHSKECKMKLLLVFMLFLLIKGTVISQKIDLGIDEFLEDESLLEKRTYTIKKDSNEKLFAIISLDRKERILHISQFGSINSFALIQYNEKWNPIERIYFHIDRISGDTTLKTISNYVYDETGKLNEHNTFKYKYKDSQSIEQLPKSQKYLYAQNGKYISDILKYYPYEDESKLKQVKTEYLYDRKGRLRKRSFYETEINSNDFELCHVYEYKYFPFGKRKRKEKISFLCPNNGNTYIIKYKYSKNLLVRVEKWSNKKLLLSNYYTYQNGVLMEDHSIANYDGFTIDIVHRYEYIRIKNDQ